MNSVEISPSIAKSPPVDMSIIKAKSSRYEESTIITTLSKSSTAGKSVLSVIEDIGQAVKRNRSLQVPEESYPLVSFNSTDR